MAELGLMGEGNAIRQRRVRTPFSTILATSAIYEQLYKDPKIEGVPASFHVCFFIYLSMLFISFY